MTSDESVGDKVRRWRQANDLTERAAAKRIGVSQPTLRAVERDRLKRIGLGVALAFVRGCDGEVTIDDFVTSNSERAA